MSKLELLMVESETKIVLEALTEKESKLLSLCDESDDEDVVADAGNDLVELRLLLNSFRQRAVKLFGDGVLNFSGDLL